MSALIALLLAIGAITAQPTPPPADFVQGAVEWSVPVWEADFIGSAWVCDPADEGIGWQPEVGPSPEQVEALRAAAVAETTENDVCYAGIDPQTGAAKVGP